MDNKTISIAGGDSIAVPNYDVECDACGSLPTVDVEENGKVVHKTSLCGVCCWGQSDCIDPDEWN